MNSCLCSGGLGGLCRDDLYGTTLQGPGGLFDQCEGGLVVHFHVGQRLDDLGKGFAGHLVRINRASWCGGGGRSRSSWRYRGCGAGGCCCCCWLCSLLL